MKRITTAPGVYFCASRAAADATLFAPVGGRTASGWYKRRARAVIFYGMDGEPVAALGLPRGSWRGPWLASCFHAPDTRRLRFMCALGEWSARRLGIPLETETEAAAAVYAQLFPNGQE